jgi:hypothetical protein
VLQPGPGGAEQRRVGINGKHTVRDFIPAEAIAYDDLVGCKGE